MIFLSAPTAASHLKGLDSLFSSENEMFQNGYLQMLFTCGPLIIKFPFGRVIWESFRKTTPHRAFMKKI